MIILKFAHLKNLWGYLKMTDEIIKELWKIKDGIAKEYNCDVKAFVNYLRTKRREGDPKVVDLRTKNQTTEQVG